MKTLLFVITILISTVAFSQRCGNKYDTEKDLYTTINMGAGAWQGTLLDKKTISPMIQLKVGVLYKNITFTGNMVFSPMPNNTPAYLEPKIGYIFNIDKFFIHPNFGYSYGLVSTDNKSLNRSGSSSSIEFGYKSIYFEISKVNDVLISTGGLKFIF